MNKNKSDLIINAIALFFLLSVVLKIYGIIRMFLIPNFSISSRTLVPFLSLCVMVLITYLLFTRKKIGWYLTLANSLIIIILTIINLFTYKVYLGSIGIFTFGEFLANKKELFSILRYITTSITFNGIIIYILLKKNIKNQFLEVNIG